MQDELPLEDRYFFLCGVFGFLEAIARFGRPISFRDIERLEKDLKEKIKATKKGNVPIFNEEGHSNEDDYRCEYCGGEIKAFQHITHLSDSPPDPIEACVDCGRKAD